MANPKPSLRDRLLGDRQAVADHKTATVALNAHTGTEEDDDYLALNQNATDTAQHVPWWRR